MRAGYTETKFVGNYIYNIVTNKKSVYVYTETKFVGNYIYNIVTNKNDNRAYWGRGFEPSKRKPPQNLNFLDNLRAM